MDPALLFQSGSRVLNLASLNGQLIDLRVDGGFRGEGNSGGR